MMKKFESFIAGITAGFENGDCKNAL